MLLQVKVPKELRLKQRIVDKYTWLYREYRRFYPEKKDYTYKQLRRNIAEVASIVNTMVDTNDMHNSTFTPWLDNGWKQLYYRHWYFALVIMEINGDSKAVVMDAHYEGDHHNDILLSTPYDWEDAD